MCSSDVSCGFDSDDAFLQEKVAPLFTLRMPLDSFITIREMSLDQLGQVMLAGFLHCKELFFCHSALSEISTSHQWIP